MATIKTPEIQGQLVAQDDTRVLQKLFTGHLVAGHGISGGVLLSKVTKATATTVTVTIPGFSTQTSANPTPTVRCYYQPQPQASGTTKMPPVGTKCFIALPSNEPTKYGIVLAFVGWPT